MFVGEPNRIEIKIRRITKDKKETLFTLDGRWDKQIMIKDAKTEKVELFYDANATQLQKKIVAPLHLQGPYESSKCGVVLLVFVFDVVVIKRSAMQ